MLFWATFAQIVTRMCYSKIASLWRLGDADFVARLLKYWCAPCANRRALPIIWSNQTMADIILFHFEQSEVRYVGDGVKHEWVAQDICDILGIKNARDAISDFPDTQAGVATVYVRSENGTQQARELRTVKEPGLYRLIFKSRKAIAQKFQNWVTEEVIPSIRQTGSYQLAEDKASLERQYQLPPTQKELKGGHGLYKLMYGKAYADRWLVQKLKEFYPALGPIEPPIATEVASLPTAKALLTPTQIAEELQLFYASGKGNAIKVNKLLSDLGYQEKIQGQWSATQKAIAANLCDRKPVDTNSRTQKDQLLWSADIALVLKEHILEVEK
jgi:prophage antirepressor-like protein